MEELLKDLDWIARKYQVGTTDQKCVAQIALICGAFLKIGSVLSLTDVVISYANQVLSELKNR